MARTEYEFMVGDRTWTLDYHDLTMNEWMAAERATGLHWAALAAAVDARSALGILTFWWLARRREDPTLGFDAPEMRVKATELTMRIIEEPEGEQSPDPQPLPTFNGSVSGVSATSS